MPIESLRAQFLQDGYAVVDDFLSGPEVDAILASIDAYRAAGRQVLQVERKDLIATQVFKTIVGSDCESHIKGFSELWRSRILDLARQLVPFSLEPLNDAAIGINVNITERSGTLSYHYDRNEVTAVLYLQECVGGELEMFPHFRVLLPHRYRWPVMMVQRAFDLVWRTPPALFIARRRRRLLPPKRGRLVLMRGPLSLHRVSPVEEGPSRICGVFCYDKPDVRWESWNSKDNYVVQSLKKAKALETRGQ